MSARVPAAHGDHMHTARYRQYETPQLADSFFGPGRLIALASAILVLFVLLFPRALIHQQLTSGTRPDAATIAYLHLLLHAQPADRDLRVQLARAHLDAGQLQRARTTLQPIITRTPGDATVTALWLQLQRKRMYATPPGSAARADARATYAADLQRMTARLAPSDQLLQIQHASAAGLHQTAAHLARHLLAVTATSNRSQSAATRTTGASPPSGATQNNSARAHHRPAVSVHRFTGLIWASGPYVTTAAESTHAPAQDLRAQAFSSLIDAHLAAGQPSAALQAAQQHIDSMKPSQLDWNRLIHIADWANRPAAAAGFARRWLILAGNDTTRWMAFRALVSAYLAADKPVQALAAARAHIHAMPASPTLWRFMTQLAMQAGDADASVLYARRLVYLQDGNAH